MSNIELPLVFDREVPRDSILMVDVVVTYRNGKTGVKKTTTVVDVVMRPDNYNSNVDRVRRKLAKGVYPVRLDAKIKTSTK